MEIGVISLLKCFKELGKIVVDNKNETFKHIDDETVIFSRLNIYQMLLSSDSMIALKAL
jgi:hypothetical protein